MLDDQIGVRPEIYAADLLTLLWKLHHMTLVWSAGRPCLYALRVPYFTATFARNNPSKLRPAKQNLAVSTEAAQSVLFWWDAVTRRPAPTRRILVCNKRYASVTLDILYVKEYPATDRPLWVSIPSAWWRRPARVMEDLEKPLEDVTSERICVWLETLLEGLEVMDVPHETEAIIVRTNIYKLAEAIDRDLYVKSEKGAQISQRIHTHI